MTRTLLDRALDDPAPLRSLPQAATDLLRKVSAPPRLAAHLRAVHDVAFDLTSAVATAFPDLEFRRDDVLFGAATHDIGKVVHTNELFEPGSLHERAGFDLLVDHGIAPRLARFAATHGTWTVPGIGTEDLLVSLADKIWKAQRIQDLEDRIVNRVAGRQPWQVFMELDEILDRIAHGADDRLQFQNAYPTVAL